MKRARRRNAAASGAPRSLIGRDLARAVRPADDRHRWLLPLLLGALVAAVALTALRNDLTRIQYGLAEALREEKRLLEEQRLLTAEVSRLRDPARLAKLARERGFERPAQVILLPPVASAPGGRP